MKTLNVVATKEAPSAIGPYSQAVEAGPFLYLSGQIPLDPQSGVLVGNSIAPQTEQVMKNITAILAARNLTLRHIVKSTVFLQSMDDFPVFNETYQKFLEPPFPARSTVEVAQLPKGALVEIETIALLA